MYNFFVWYDNMYNNKFNIFNNYESFAPRTSCSYGDAKRSLVPSFLYNNFIHSYQISRPSMENLKNKIGITLFEYHCQSCGKFFWISECPKEILNCPYCLKESIINGDIPIQELIIGRKDDK